MSTSLTLEAVAVEFGTHFSLYPLSTEIADATFVGLIGPNGAGKSTLVRAIAALIEPSSGQVRVGDRELRRMGHSERARCVAYLAQSTPASWPITVAELVALGRLPHRDSLSRHEDARAMEDAIERTALGGLIDRAITELSGGEYARAQLARALCVEAPIILADEPIAQLDPFHQLQIMDLLREHAHGGHLVIAVLHDLALAARYCDRLLLLEAGRLVADGSPAIVLSADRLRSVYHVDAIVEDRDGLPLIVPWRRCE